MTALTPAHATSTADLVEVDRGTLATLVHEHEALIEAVSDYARAASGVADILRRDDQGWSRLGGDAEEAIDRERLLEKVALARVMAAADRYGSRDLMGVVARGCVEQSAGGGLHMFVRIGDGQGLVGE